MPTVALPPKVRAVIYLVYSLLGVTVGAIQVGYLAAGLDQPTWLTVALAVVPFLGAGLGITAASNTKLAEPTYVAPATMTVGADVAPVADAAE
jgi:hypothetical protein